PSPKTTRIIEEWARSAAEVNADDKDMSALWRAVLDEILGEGGEGADLLRVVKSQPASDIRFFLECYPRPEEPLLRQLRTLVRWDQAYDDAVTARLTSAGLVQRRYSLRRLITFLLLTIAPLFTMYVVITNSPKWDTLPVGLVLVLGFMVIVLTAVTALLY